MSSREGRLEVPAGHKPELLLKQDRGSLEAAVRRRRGESQGPSPELGDRLDPAVPMREDLHLVPKGPVLTGHHGGGHESRTVHGQRNASGVESRNVKSPGPHRFDLGRVGLHGKEEYLPGHGPLEVIQKSRPDVPELGRILHGRVREDQPLRVEAHARIPGRVCHHVAVRVTVARVEVAVRTVLHEWARATHAERRERSDRKAA